MSDLDRWKNATKENAPDLIITGTKLDTENLYTSYYSDILKMQEKGNTILDFGCGVGRNSIALLQKYKYVHCFDYPNMIGMLASTDIYDHYKDRIKLHTDWDKIKKYKFDAIFCCLVLQHIYEEDFMQYIKDFKEMTNLLYVCSRAYCDDHYKNVYTMLQKEWELHPDDAHRHEKITKFADEDHYFIKMIPRRI